MQILTPEEQPSTSEPLRVRLQRLAAARVDAGRSHADAADLKPSTEPQEGDVASVDSPLNERHSSSQPQSVDLSHHQFTALEAELTRTRAELEASVAECRRLASAREVERADLEGQLHELLNEYRTALQAAEQREQELEREHQRVLSERTAERDALRAAPAEEEQYEHVAEARRAELVELEERLESLVAKIQAERQSAEETAWQRQLDVASERESFQRAHHLEREGLRADLERATAEQARLETAYGKLERAQQQIAEAWQAERTTLEQRLETVVGLYLTQLRRARESTEDHAHTIIDRYRARTREFGAERAAARTALMIATAEHERLSAELAEFEVEGQNLPRNTTALSPSASPLSEDASGRDTLSPAVVQIRASQRIPPHDLRAQLAELIAELETPVDAAKSPQSVKEDLSKHVAIA